jgi:hypothetical protein
VADCGMSGLGKATAVTLAADTRMQIAWQCEAHDLGAGVDIVILYSIVVLSGIGR